MGPQLHATAQGDDVLTWGHQLRNRSGSGRLVVEPHRVGKAEEPCSATQPRTRRTSVEASGCRANHARLLSAILLRWAALGGSALVSLLAGHAQSPTDAQLAAGTQWVTLGTLGGPVPDRHRAQPANLLVVNGASYLVDAGNGVAAQLAKAGVGPGAIATMFISHNHNDHNADMGTLRHSVECGPLRTGACVWTHSHRGCPQRFPSVLRS